MVTSTKGLADSLSDHGAVTEATPSWLPSLPGGQHRAQHAQQVVFVRQCLTGVTPLRAGAGSHGKARHSLGFAVSQEAAHYVLGSFLQSETRLLY